MTTMTETNGSAPGDAPTVSVLVPVLDEEEWISEVIERLAAQSLPSIEIIIADGGSTDATRAIVADYAAADTRVRLIDNPGRIQSSGLNRALAVSRAPIVARLDGHAFVEADYLERCVALLGATGADVVGGRMRALPPADDAATPAAIGVVNGAWWGAGPARFHRAGPAGFADTVYLGCFRRPALVAAGGWSEDVGVNEDYELNYRIRRDGGRVYYDPALEVGYVPRRTLRQLAGQYRRYGQSKALMLKKHPASARWRQLLPAALVPAGLIALAGPRRARTLARTAMVTHAAVVTACAISERDTAARVRCRAAGAALLMHWCWAGGFWAGRLRR
jgi:glycosyltransferase involved in cell wall biosynthesis